VRGTAAYGAAEKKLMLVHSYSRFPTSVWVLLAKAPVVVGHGLEVDLYFLGNLLCACLERGDIRLNKSHFPFVGRSCPFRVERRELRKDIAIERDLVAQLIDLTKKVDQERVGGSLGLGGTVASARPGLQVCPILRARCLWLQ